MDHWHLPGVVILLLAPVLLFVGCSGGGQAAPKTAPPATTAAVSLSLKNGWTASSPWGMRVIEWKLEPLKLEGSEGRGITLILKKQYSPRLVPEKGGFRCYLDEDSITDLRPGRGASVRTGAPSAKWR